MTTHLGFRQTVWRAGELNASVEVNPLNGCAHMKLGPLQLTFTSPEDADAAAAGAAEAGRLMREHRAACANPDCHCKAKADPS